MSTDAPPDPASAPTSDATSAPASDTVIDDPAGDLTAPPAEAVPEALDLAVDVAEGDLEAEPVDDPAEHRFECLSCGFVYDPAEGVRKLAIAPGTPFLELDPIRFRCPVCRSKVGAFKDIGPRNKPSGFEENLNFGLGVNRLTPGQKNVLIFGAFALAIAFFLSLYSLR
jgi:rubredoxin